MFSTTHTFQSIYYALHSETCFEKAIESRWLAVKCSTCLFRDTVIGSIFTVVAGASSIVKIPFQVIYFPLKDVNPCAGLGMINQSMWGVKEFILFAVHSVKYALATISSIVFGVVLSPDVNFKIQRLLNTVSDGDMDVFENYFRKNQREKESENLNDSEKIDDNEIEISE